MKKILSVFLSLSLCAMMAACGGQSSSAPATPAAPASSGGNEAATPSVAAKTFKLGHSLTESSAFHKACVKFKEIVEEKSGGSIGVEIYANAALGSEGDMAEGLVMGTVDAALIGPSSVSKLEPTFEVFNLPYLFRDNAHADAVTMGEVGEHFKQSIYDASGVRPLSFWESGFRHYSNNKHEINSPADMSGLLIRIPSSSVQAATLQALGASSTNIATGEIYIACSNGTIDGQESPIDTVITSNFNEVQKYMVLDGQVYGVMGFLMNGKLFDSFTPEQQQLLMDAADEAGVYEREVRRTSEAEQLEKLKETMTINETPNKEEWKAAVQSVYDQYYDVFGRELIEQIENTAA